MKSIIVTMTLLALGNSFPTPAHAESFKGTIQFNNDQRHRHLGALDSILEDAAECLAVDLKIQQDFFKQHGISAFYGDRSAFAKLSTEGKREHLRNLGKNPKLLEKMKTTSCVGLTLKCLGGAFIKNGQADLWEPIRVFTMNNGVDGTAMQTGLRELGWKILYWNPDTSSNTKWDAQEKSEDPSNKKRFWGYHSYRLSTVKKFGTYYLSKVDDPDSLVNFDVNVPPKFRRVPFFVGTAHAGYHVFPGSFGQVIEGHSMRAITDPNTLESSEFNPNKDGGGPRGFYRSGIIAVPPNYGF